MDISDKGAYAKWDATSHVVVLLDCVIVCLTMLIFVSRNHTLHIKLRLAVSPVNLKVVF